MKQKKGANAPETQEEIKSAQEEKGAAMETAECAADQECSEASGKDVSQLESELDELRDKYMRMAAEYDNFRRRTQKEREALFTDATALTALSFLPILDNLERASSEETTDEAYKKGVEMILKQFLDVLSKLRITEIDALDKEFNPDIHNAVMHVDDESLPENTVCQVLQKGYMIGDRVLRHAMVKVAN